MLSNFNFKDRRRRRRQMLNTSVRVTCGDLRLHALGINLSDVGMCLFAVAHLDVGSKIEVEFVPPESREALRVHGTVKHRALYLYGIEFLNSCSHVAESLAGVGANDRA